MRNKIIYRYLLSPATALFLITAIFISTAQADAYISKGLDNNTPSGKPATEFACSDRIYAVVIGNWPAKSKHVLEAYWIDPRGKQREHSRYKFIAKKGQTRAWVWLQLHPGSPDIIDRVLMQGDDSAREFNGKWKVSIYIDGKKEKDLSFHVTCG